MPLSTPSRYIVRARDENGALSAFIHSIDGDPEIALVDQIGPAGKPHTLVISVPADRASALEERFRQTPQLMLERDRPLSLF